MCKLPIHYKGDRCNRVEAQRWRERADLHAEQWLCPVLAAAADGSWLVMARAVPEPEKGDPPAHPLHIRRLDDTGRRNWGTYDGRLVLVDYGYPRRSGA